MANKRTFWACEGLGTCDHGTGTTSPAVYEYCPGIQSVGMSTNFNLEQIFELGQLEIYQDLEEIPDIELTVERVIDQFALLYNRGMDHTAFLAAGAGATFAVTIVGDQDNRVDIGFVIGDSKVGQIGDAAGVIAGNPAGGQEAFAYMSGMFVSSVNFNFDTEGYFTESVTLVGNHKKWAAPGGDQLTGAPTTAALDAGDVAKRQRLVAHAMPAPLSALAADTTALSNVSISVDFGREEMFVLGKRQPYHRYVTFPVEVTCDIEAYVTDTANMVVNALPESNNVTQQTIAFKVLESSATDILTAPGGVATLHMFDLGEKNKLQSVTWNGIDTGGTNATITYSYRNFNKLDVTSVGDKN